MNETIETNHTTKHTENRTTNHIEKNERTQRENIIDDKKNMDDKNIIDYKNKDTNVTIDDKIKLRDNATNADVDYSESDKTDSENEISSGERTDSDKNYNETTTNSNNNSIVNLNDKTRSFDVARDNDILTGRRKRSKRVNDSRFNVFFHTEFPGISSLLTGKMSFGFGLSRSASNTKIKDEIEINGTANNIARAFAEGELPREICDNEIRAITDGTTDTSNPTKLVIEEVE